MLRKTTLSKILSAAIAAITVTSPLAVSANPTSSQGDEKNSPETTKVSSQETFDNPDLIPPPVPAKRRKSTGSIPSSTKKAKTTTPSKQHRSQYKLPYDISIGLDSYFSKKSNKMGTYAFIKFRYNGKTTIKELQLLITIYKQMLVNQARSYGIDLLDSTILKSEDALNDIINSGSIMFEVTRFEKESLMTSLKNLIIDLCNELNIQFDNIYT